MRLEVHLTNNRKNCFVAILCSEKNKIFRTTSASIAKISVVSRKELFYTLVESYKESENNKLCISKTFASTVNLKEKDIVKVEIIDPSELNVLEKVFFKASDEDFEKLRPCVNKLEETILNQVKCVSQNSTIPIWINNQIVVNFTIDSLDPPGRVGLLQDSTELHYLPMSSSSKTRSTMPKPDTMFMSMFSNYFNINKADVDFHAFHASPKYARICSLGSRKPSIEKNSLIGQFSYIVYVNSESKSHQILKSSSWPVFAFDQLNFKNEGQTSVQFLSQIYELDEIARESILNQTADNAGEPNEDTYESARQKKSLNESTSQVKIIECTGAVKTAHIRTDDKITEASEQINMSIPPSQQIDSAEDMNMEEDIILIYVDQQLLTELHLTVGAKFSLSGYEEKYNCEKVILHASISDSVNESLQLHDAKQVIDKWFLSMEVPSKNLFLLNQNSTLNCPVDNHMVPVRIELVPGNVQFCIYDTKIKREIKINDEQCKTVKNKESGQINNRTIANNTSFNPKTLFLNHLEQTLTSLVVQIRGSLRSGHIYRDNILVAGPEGCGKTTLCYTLQEALQNAGPDSIHCQVIDCKQMKGKISNAVDKQLRDILATACYMEPACVILDEVNVLCSCTKENLDAAAIIQSNKLCSLFVSLVREFQVNSNIIIVGVTSSKDIIKSTRAGLVFSHQYTLPALDQNNRSRLLESLIKAKLMSDHFNMNNIDVTKVSKLCEGYSIQDMCDIVDKAMFHYLHNTVDLDPDSASDEAGTHEAKLFSTEDLEVSFHGHVPLALKGIKMDAAEPIDFSHVGGLKSAKQLLIETLVWPSMYPELFSQCPLKPQSGILLYGAPGTGKTLLASAISGECGLKFISIKGPELFSKFIGESEEGVRNIFNRARSLQPCILFFDEFDSLAAKRGNDSTGVKDRVVNQLLTELDGVEGLDGVYVVGATSRPDIIDPALLRPGRLGSSVHCTVPDEIEREDILSVLTQQVKLNADVNLSEIARRTESFTGADLLGLLCSAQMIQQDADEDSSEETAICQADLLKALEDTKPSLSVLDSLKFDQIYRNFVNNKGLSSEDIRNQKVISA